MRDWIDRAYDELEGQLANKEITPVQYKKYVQQLREEVREDADHDEYDF